tara:strand:- start:378 stop:3509 length:3132 start_codon:yes stop_codon:yes gene_type:complete
MTQQPPADYGTAPDMLGRKIFFSCLIFVLIAGTAVFAWHKHQENLHRERIAETARLSESISLILSDKTTSLLKGYIASVQIALQTPSMKNYIKDPVQGKQELGDLFLSIAQKRTDVYKIRLIDQNGKETIRSDRAPDGQIFLKAEEDLQDKSDRYFFQNSIKLAPGQIYVTRLDLNMDNGVIETPWVPTIRIITPFSRDGETAEGIFMYNINAGDILSSFQRLNTENAYSDFMLVNENGYYLAGRPAEDLWGFMFDHDTGMHTDHPDVWKTLHGQKKQIHHAPDGDVWFAHKIDLQQALTATAGNNIISERQRWYIITHTHPPPPFSLSGSGVLLAVAGSLILMVFSWFCGNGIVEQQKVKILKKDLERRIAEKEEMIALVQTVEREEKKQRQFLNTLLDNMPLAIFVKDARKDFRWVMINKMARRMFGLKPQEIVGKYDKDILTKSEAAAMLTTDRAVMDSGEILELEAERITTAAGTLNLHIIKVPIYDEEHDQALLLTMYKDVSEQVQTQEALKRERDRAEHANQAKSDFLANMSHELRTPLNAIIGMNDLLDTHKLDEENYTAFEVIHKSAQSLLAIVDDVLDISKIEAGDMKLEKVPFDCFEIIHHVTKSLSHLASQKGLTLTCNIGKEDSLIVKGDPSRFHRIMNNLVINAIRYTHQGSVDVTASSIPGPRRNRVILQCDVRDTGIGIPKNRIGAIFEKFTQADTSTTRHYGGSGLGLTIIKELIGMMKGEISVKSDVGIGSCFTIKIPFTTADMAETQRKKASPQMLPEMHNDRRVMIDKARLLIAEDHDMNRMVVEKLLRKIGCKSFDFAENGQEAVEMATAKKYDLILMDCHMPELSGYDATRAIRRIEKETGRKSPTPIIAMTADAMQGTKEKCLEVGMNEYITKPLNINDMAELLSYWLIFDAQQLSDAHITVSGAAKQETPVPINLVHINDYTDGDKDEQRELLGLFKQQFAESLARLKEQITPGRNKEWSEIAHQMKGGAAMIGAEELRTLCAEAQNKENTTKTERQNLYKEITAAYDSVCSYMEEEELI